MSVECERPDGCCMPKFPIPALPCENVCYAKSSRELTERWDREEDERTARGVYRGCPVCKQKVLLSCHHDGVDYSTVDLPLPIPEGCE